MKVKRIATLPTFKKYEEDLTTLIPKYLKKSECSDNVDEILGLIKRGCHDPHFNCCVVVDEEVLKGFVIAYVMVDYKGRRIMVDHFHAPNMKLAGAVYKMVVGKLCQDFNIDELDVYFMTYRNPEAWEKFS
ncbi:MAG: hypothetical protein ACXABY_35575, partial [Candidatus Thorarchaeota archaeon]